MNQSTQLDLAHITPDNLEEAYIRHGSGLSNTELNRTSVSLQELRTAPCVFQFRDYAHQQHEKTHHVKNLVRAVKNGDGHLDPIEVFPVAGQRIVLDGHCRLAAYRRAGYRETTDVPVEHFTGDFSQALLRAAEANSKDKLPLALREKLEAAWRLVKHDPRGEIYSLRTIQEKTGTSKSTAGNMRNAILDDSLDFDPRECTWRQVKRQRQTGKEWDSEALESLADSWARRLSGALGHKPVRMPEVLFDALERCYPSIFPNNVPTDWVSSSLVMEVAQECEDFEF